MDLQKEMVDPIPILHNAAEQVALVEKEINETNVVLQDVGTL